MATIEQAPRPSAPDVAEASAELVANPLNSLLARAYTLNWEMIFYTLLLVAAVLTRFVNLGDRVMSHDESLHTKYSLDLYQQGNYQHTPLMHGPVLFHMTALMYLLFGPSDFSARLYPAILGVILVFMPRLLFQRWLGKIGAAVASILLLISPFVLFHNRYIREDTPSIFFTLILVYAIFAYLDGLRPRQLRWLMLAAAGMVLSLASKEVGFMYVAIFGSALTLVWLFQVTQGIRSGDTDPVVGWIIGGVIGLAVWGGASIALGAALGSVFQAASIPISARVAEVGVAILLGACAFALLRPLRNLLEHFGQRANSMFKLSMAGIILGTIAALGMIAVLNIAKPSAAATDPAVMQRLILWSALVIGAILLVVVATAFGRFSGAPWSAVGLLAVIAAALLLIVIPVPILSRMLMWLALIGVGWLLFGTLRASGGLRLPLADLLYVAIIAAGCCFVMVVFEERSLNSNSQPPSTINDIYVWVTYVIGILAVGGILFLRFRTPFFEDMKRFPVFDVLIMMGTMILPWLAAFPVWLSGYSLDANSLSPDVILISFKAVVPFIAVSVTAGLCWNPTAWLACAATFYSIFGFFYTTIFTNINGIGTGLFGSLGYWLAQQGVRRGSQPQYYYLLVELPIYEYLPVIGALVAGTVGMLGLWRFRSQRYAAAAEARATAAASALDMPAATDLLPAAEESDGASTTPGSELSNGPVESATDYSAEDTPDSTQASEFNEAESTETLEPLPDQPEALPGEEEASAPLPEVIRERHAIEPDEVLDRAPFLPFVGMWAVLITLMFTLAGEKMPWLTTHLTIPMIFLTGWYLGTQLEKIEGRAFWKIGWPLVVLTPILVIALANVFGPLWVGARPFAGLQSDDLLRTFTWLGAALLAGLIGYGVFQVWRRIGTQQAARIVIIGVFVLLALMTARIAWMAAFINYDSAREFMVYAHGAPADKQIMTVIEDISKRTTDGMNIKVGYDSEISWPGTWYFRDYPNAHFLGDDAGSTPDLASYTAVVVGNKGNPKVEALLGDKFYKFKYIRLWWPMQDYFDLTPDRIDHLFTGFDNTTFDTNNQSTANHVSGPDLMQGLWDIWWNRDYTAYGKAVGKDFSESNWPVSDPMFFYVNKNVASTIWDFGTGATKVIGPAKDPFDNLGCDQCSASTVFSQEGSGAGQLNHPRGMHSGPDGNVYIADSQNARISVFSPDSGLVREFGKAGSVDQSAAGGMFREPWGVTVGKDGTIYVADTWNHRIQEFTSQGAFIRMWGAFEQVATGTSGKPDGFWGPRDIAVDAANNVYVADTGNKRIRVYSQDGTWSYDIGVGDATVQLNEPVGLALNDATGELYIADTWNKRIEVYDLNSRQFVRSWGVTAWGPTTESGNRPYLALDKTGEFLFVTDPDVGRVLVFDNKGKPLVTFGRQSGVLGGITVNSAGQIFVADANSGVIMRYEMSSLPRLTPPVSAPNPKQPQPTSDTF